jgi:hypothetical protein
MSAYVGDVFCTLIGDSIGEEFIENENIRSEIGSDTIDIQLRGQWYRMSFEPIDEPRPPVPLEDFT